MYIYILQLDVPASTLFQLPGDFFEVRSVVDELLENNPEMLRLDALGRLPQLGLGKTMGKP